LTALMLSDAGGYRDLDVDGRLWVPSGQAFFSPDPDQPDAVFARNHRYLPQGARDAFGNRTTLGYDGHQLFVAASVDALNNGVSASYDYRVLQAAEVTDANSNRSAVAFDIFGRVAATATMGKLVEPDGRPRGDSLQGIVADLSEAQLDAFVADPIGQAPA